MHDKKIPYENFMDRTPLQQNILVFIGEKIHIYSLEDFRNALH
jgi:hypothetical protein